MINLKILSIKEVMLLAKFRNIEGYENMFQKQLKSILSTSYFLKPALNLWKVQLRNLFLLQRLKTLHKLTPAPRTKKKLLYDLKSKEIESVFNNNYPKYKSEVTKNRTKLLTN